MTSVTTLGGYETADIIGKPWSASAATSSPSSGEDIDDGAHAAHIADRLVTAFDEPFMVGGEERFGSVSLGGMVTEPDSDRGPEGLLSDADAAMYQAKERGRGRFESSTPGCATASPPACAWRPRRAPS